jgi:hypothetical protein
MIGGLDTHETVKSLTAAGFTDAQAEAVTAAVKSAVRIDLSNLGTKTDIEAVRAEIALLRAELEAKIERGKVDMIKWVVGMGFAQVAMVIALLRLMGSAHP